MVYDHHSLEGGPRAESIRALAPQLDVGEETLRNWSNRYGPAEVASGPQNPLAEENRRLRRKLAEARRANEILKNGSAFSQPLHRGRRTLTTTPSLAPLAL